MTPPPRAFMPYGFPTRRRMQLTPLIWPPLYSSPCYGRHSMFTLANVLLYLYMISIVPRIHLSGIVSSLGFSNGFTTPPTQNIYDPLIWDRRTISVFGHIYNIIRNISRRIRSLGENPSITALNTLRLSLSSSTHLASASRELHPWSHFCDAAVSAQFISSYGPLPASNQSANLFLITQYYNSTQHAPGLIPICIYLAPRPLGQHARQPPP